MVKVGFVGPPQVDGPIFSWSYQYQAWDEDLSNIDGIQVVLSSQTTYVRTSANKIKEKIGTGRTDSFDAYDLKIGKNDEIYYISLIASANDFVVHEWVGGAGIQLAGTAIKVAVDTSGSPWVVNSYGDVHQMIGSSWSAKGGQATDIIIGDKNTPFVVGKTPTEGGKIIQKWDSVSNSWETLPGIGGVSLALDSEENPYVVTEDHKVYRQKGLVYSLCPGKFNILIFN